MYEDEIMIKGGKELGKMFFSELGPHFSFSQCWKIPSQRYTGVRFYPSFFSIKRCLGCSRFWCEYADFKERKKFLKRKR